MERNDKKYALVLVTRSLNGKLSFKVRDRFATRKESEEAKRVWLSKLFGAACDADYRVLGPVQLKKLQAEVDRVQQARREKGAKKAQETRKRRGTKPSFVLCPTCGCKSKKLYSEMGGLQTRRCQRGHVFEFDKWIADRAFWGPILGSGVPDPFWAK